jgi:hypothetical protein
VASTTAWDVSPSCVKLAPNTEQSRASTVREEINLYGRVERRGEREERGYFAVGVLHSKNKVLWEYAVRLYTAARLWDARMPSLKRARYNNVSQVKLCISYCAVARNANYDQYETKPPAAATTIIIFLVITRLLDCWVDLIGIPAPPSTTDGTQETRDGGMLLAPIDPVTYQEGYYCFFFFLPRSPAVWTRDNCGLDNYDALVTYPGSPYYCGSGKISCDSKQIAQLSCPLISLYPWDRGLERGEAIRGPRTIGGMVHGPPSSSHNG